MAVMLQPNAHFYRQPLPCSYNWQILFYVSLAFTPPFGLRNKVSFSYFHIVSKFLSSKRNVAYMYEPAFMAAYVEHSCFCLLNSKSCSKNQV